MADSLPPSPDDQLDASSEEHFRAVVSTPRPDPVALLRQLASIDDELLDHALHRRRLTPEKIAFLDARADRIATQFRLLTDEEANDGLPALE